MKKFLISILMITLMIGTALSATACSKEDPEIPEGQAILVLDLDSDSDNGVEGEYKQSKEIFTVQSIFIENEAVQEGSGEMQEFTLIPDKAGTTTIEFTNATTKTKYTYDIEVNEEKDKLEVKSSTGEVDGAEAEAPEMINDSY